MKNQNKYYITEIKMFEEFVDNNGKTFLELAKRKIPVLFIGAGALEYNKSEAKDIKII